MRTILTINAKNKWEALAAIDMIKAYIRDSSYDGEVKEVVQVTNEGKLLTEEDKND